jgi:hypothetical protein
MTTELISSKSSEANELRIKQAELAALQSALAERELYLADLRIHLAAFEGRYLRQVGVLYAELDDWNAKIAELVAMEEGTQEAVATAKEARTQATESYSATHGEASRAPDLEEPTPELKRLFREVAKQIHPDLATDEADRAKRGRLMADANAAFRRGDAGALRSILTEYENSPEAVKGTGPAADLLRVIRQIGQVSKRLSDIETVVTELTSSDTAKLMAKAQIASDQGIDLLAEMAAEVRERIAAARSEYVNSTLGTRTQ